MMVAIAVVTGLLSFLNFYWWINSAPSGVLAVLSAAGQVALLGLTVFAAIGYQGIRRKRLFALAPYKIFTLPFAIILVSLLGNLCVLVVLGLRLAA